MTTPKLYLITYDERQNVSFRMNPTPDAMAAHMRNAADAVRREFGAAEWRVERRTYTEWLRLEIERAVRTPIRLQWKPSSRVRYDRSIAAQDARFAEMRANRNEGLWR